MPTTTKMGIVYPASTDLVKDGATAMGTISTTVDNKTGLVLLNTTTFNGVASQALASVFNTNFINYRIKIDFTGVTGDGNVYIKMRSGSTDNSTSYTMSGFYLNTYSGSTSSVRDNGGTSGFFIGFTENASNAHTYSFNFDVSYPFETQYTTITGQSTSVSSGSSGQDSYQTFFSGHHYQAVSYDGINILPAAGNITGKAFVYGYNQ